MKKILYSVCVSFLFIVFLIGISSTLTFLIAKPTYDQRPIETEVQVENYVIQRREENRNITFYLDEQQDLTVPKVIVIAYSLYDMEKSPFVFIVETPKNYIHATINQAGFASGIIVEKS